MECGQGEREPMSRRVKIEREIKGRGWKATVRNTY